ncbi:F-box protein At2g39490-like isoform X2 [Rhodamnia argentea]|uniref:F-box protein At2g39490-like isoform X2 n=1 Tax=Rhodamnia argentea TaxID=178133 RepID=A0ABM3GTZ0_9MYRT|nr:F-box protein At2g39490-like isoform X2 [Rhodamnia argentea]
MTQEHLDLISNLPEDILQRINSFLPLKEAVRTSLLSTQWRSLWTPTVVNHFHAGDGPTATVNAVEDSLEAIGAFLGSYDSPEMRKLCFRLPEGHVTVVATKGVDKELHLNFLHSEKEEQKCYSPIRRELVASVAEHFASSLLANCQLLHSLKIEKCGGLKRIAIEKNESLKSLIIADCLDIENVTVSATGLRSFVYKGLLTQIHMKNGLNLVDVVLDLEGAFGHGDFDCEEVLSLLSSLKEVETLTTSGWLLEWLCSAGVICGRLEFQLYKLKQLRWIDSLMDAAKRDSLACFLNICPILEKLFITIDPSRSRVICPYFHQHWHEPHLWMDFPTVKSNVLQLKHLTLIEFLGFTIDGEDGLLSSLVDLLLENTIVLKSIMVKSHENVSWGVTKVPSRRPTLKWWNCRRRTAISLPRNFSFALIEDR